MVTSFGFGAMSGQSFELHNTVLIRLGRDSFRARHRQLQCFTRAGLSLYDLRISRETGCCICHMQSMSGRKHNLKTGSSGQIRSSMAEVSGLYAPRTYGKFFLNAGRSQTRAVNGRKCPSRSTAFGEISKSCGEILSGKSLLS
jgi:hypothetical protein